MDFQLGLPILLMRKLRSGNLPRIPQAFVGGTQIQTDSEPTFLTPLYVFTLNSIFSYLLPPPGLGDVVSDWSSPTMSPGLSLSRHLFLTRHERSRLWEAQRAASWCSSPYGAGIRGFAHSGSSAAFLLGVALLLGISRQLHTVVLPQPTCQGCARHSSYWRLFCTDLAKVPTREGFLVWI